MNKPIVNPKTSWLDFKRSVAFIARDFYLTRRYFSWVVVFTFYAIVNSATIVLIGVAAGDAIQTLNLILGVLLWTYLSVIFFEISNSISFERWEGTIEYTFMAPVSRITHFFGVSVFAIAFALVRVLIMMIALVLFVSANLEGANLVGTFLVLVVASVSFIGLGLISAIFPLISTENGAQATNIVQGSLLLVSGVYYPVEILPKWVQPLAYISPATYALNACRKLLGISVPGSSAEKLLGQPISAVAPELVILAVMGVVLVPLGFFVFSLAEKWAKRTGALKRSG